MFVIEEAFKELQNELTYHDILDELAFKVECKELTLEQAEYVNEAASIKYMVEKSGFSPVRKYMDRLKDINKTKPDKWDGPKEVKQWVDKYYDDIVKIAEILETEPEDMHKEDIRNAVIMIIAIITGYIACLSVITGFIWIVTYLIGTVVACVYAIMRYIRVKDDKSAIVHLGKIKEAMKKLKEKTMDNETKRKISKSIQKIEDAEAEMTAYKEDQPKEVVIRDY